MNATAAISIPLSAFARWWMREITGCIPSAWRSIGNHRSQILDVTVSPDRVTFRCTKAGKEVEIGEVGLDDAGTPLIHPLLVRIRRQINVRRATIVLRLEPQQVLRRRIVLPLVAAENLREVLTFELDRHTPFRAEDVYFDYRLINSDRQENRIAVDLVVVPRVIVDRATALMAGWAMTPDRIGIAGETFRSDNGTNLSQPMASSHGRRLARRFAAILAALAVVLLGAAAYLEFLTQERTLSVYQEGLEQRRTENLAADAMKVQLTDLLTRSQYIAQQKQGRPLLVALLHEVTRRMPDDTWFSHLRLQADRLDVSGYAPSASALIALLEESPMLSQVRFASPVTFDTKLGLERFNLSASIDPSEEMP